MENKKTKQRKSIITGLLVITLILFIKMTTAAPAGPALVGSASVDTGPAVSNGLLMNQSSGTITTAYFNVTQQNHDWRAYVGNVTGRLLLADANVNPIFEWTLTTITGEVYATRKSSSITWSNIVCANVGNVTAEETSLAFDSGELDNIQNTFDDGTHDKFVVGTTSFSANQCTYSGNTFDNNGAQTTNFDEIVLSEQTTGTNLIYASIISDDATGFDGSTYDFQMLLPEPNTQEENEAYYFYVELA